jgi:L-threonylcarbamoyladenylate synthase
LTEIGRDIHRAKALLEQGELVAVPTETVYGLAGNALNDQAIAKIYAAKDRPRFNPLILHVASIDQASRWVREVPETCMQLMKDFCPGPITFLLPKNKLVPDLVTAGSDLVAIRIPDHDLTRELLSLLEFPLAAPSANPSGYVSPVSATDVEEGLGGSIPYILDGGSCTVGLESTIVGFENDHVVVHRLGAISAEQLEWSTGKKVLMALSHASPTAPGQLKSHYATHKPLYLGDVDTYAKRAAGKKIGVISFQRDYADCAEEQYILSESGNLEEAAARLFMAMRSLDKSSVDLILAERFPDTGIGRAINDRLERAAYRDHQ